MGRPYSEEMQHLTEVYEWAMAAPLGGLPSALRALTGLPLLAVGSGGSYTTASFAAAIHRRYSSKPASAVTPLEAVSSPAFLRRSAVILTTAGGKNPDVLGAFDRLAAREPRRFLVLCARTGSPLERRAARYPHVHTAGFDLPTGKDGFLATNSLLASVVLLARGYAAAYDTADLLATSLEELLPLDGSVEGVDALCRPLWDRQSLTVLYGPNCQSAAVDLESKFAEAALGTVQLADYRNFAHGRHHWLAKRGGETGVLAFVTDDDRQLAEATLRLLPGGIPIVQIVLPGDGLVAGLAALVQTFKVVGSAGRAREIDPGDPRVPSFGRKIYHLRAFSSPHEMQSQLDATEVAALERKSGASLASLMARGTLEDWRRAYRSFRSRCADARFRGLVLDYDGTLCCEKDRFDPLPKRTCRELNRLIRSGAVLGVATGRGKSARAALRQAIQRRFWPRVVIGYYNGGDIGLLSEDGRPDGTDGVRPELVAIANALEKAFGATGHAKLTFRLPQITIEPARMDGHDLWDAIQHLIYTAGDRGVTAVRSSHSIDVVAPGVTKVAVVDRVRDLMDAEKQAPILCIGDRGRWPGNDHVLLSGPHSLSVDEVSPDPNSCWNLTAPGRRGAQAALDYLEALEITSVGLELSLD